jgi:hypothetical protein
MFLVILILLVFSELEILKYFHHHKSLGFQFQLTQLQQVNGQELQSQQIMVALDMLLTALEIYFTLQLQVF